MMISNTTIAMTTAGGIQIGLNTQSQDHAMCPVSFKAMKTIARSPQNPMPPLVFSLDIFSSPFSSFRIVKLETPLNCVAKTKFLWPMPKRVRHRLASSDLLIRKFHLQVSPTLYQNAPFSRVYVFFHHAAGTAVSGSCFFLPSTTTSTIGHTQESTFLPDTTPSYMKRFSIFVSPLHFLFVYLFIPSSSNLTKFLIFTFSNCLTHQLVNINSISLLHIFVKFPGPGRFYFRYIHFISFLICSHQVSQIRRSLDSRMLTCQTALIPRCS